MNLIALKGGPGTAGLSEELPRRVEIPLSGSAASLHFLGGVGGWAWPVGGDGTRGTPALKVIVQFADGTSEEHVLKNGEHVADAFERANVPLSADAGDFTRRGQVRYFALSLGKRAPLSKIVLESFDNDIVPVTVAITLGNDPAPGTGRWPGRWPEGRRERRRPSSRDEAHRVDAGKDQGAHHLRRQRAQLREVLRRDRQRDSGGRRLQRELHGGPRSSGSRAEERRRGARQREPPVLRHARISQGARSTSPPPARDS